MGITPKKSSVSNKNFLQEQKTTHYVLINYKLLKLCSTLVFEIFTDKLSQQYGQTFDYKRAISLQKIIQSEFHVNISMHISTHYALINTIKLTQTFAKQFKMYSALKKVIEVKKHFKLIKLI